MEKKICKVVFEFEDGTKRVLAGKELTHWIVMLLMKSDYLLPGDEHMILGRLEPTGIGGFIPQNALGFPNGRCKLKWVEVK